MNFRLLSYLLICNLLISCNDRQKPGAAALLNEQDIERLVLVGGSLISGMEQYGFFERSLLHFFPPQSLSFRNIGWSADDVFGMARSQFGSAQNTRSWQPPTAEEGFGSKVLMDHIREAAPTTLIIAYGSETAFSKNEEDYQLFCSGYQRLLDFAESQKIKLILLTPPRQEQKFGPGDIIARNAWLDKTANFIIDQAEKRGHLYVDLFNQLITDPDQNVFTQNGIQLNREGYRKMNALLLKELGLEKDEYLRLKIDKNGKILDKANCAVSNWQKTVNGVSFLLKPDKMIYRGHLLSKEPVAVLVNGELSSKSQDTLSTFHLALDSLEEQRLMATIQEKNRLHRYRLRPLNEAYIYLFRRHEMGHLAYEMEDLKGLVAEKEREINQLLSSQTYFVEIELIRDWTSPKDYPEDEVPAFIPQPDIEQELAAFNLAPGYEISLFASDPMIANPININWDTRGRAWVATSSTYPHIVPGREPNDKVVILEDTNGDGKADKHTIFAENMLVPHSVMPVPGGAYVTATTELIYFEDTDGDDIADKRSVVFDGFGNADVHHMIHGLRWTPWGDLHFTQSIYINSFIETAYGPRVLNGSGTWSFRPETEQLEVFSRGLVNPWGEAFDQWGQSFATDGAGSSGMNYIFPGSAHATAVGAPRVLRGLNSGTPKNTAAEVIYSRHFPSDWQGTVITNDFRANRTVRYALTPHQSGYRSEEVQLVAQSDHRSYRPVDAKTGPDGALYIVDWYNPIIDHGEVDFHHPIRDKAHGRIWKLTRKGKPLLEIPDFENVKMDQLLNLLKSPEQITRLLANRAFVERKGDPQLVLDWLSTLPKSHPDYARHQLEALWLLTALNFYPENLLQTVLKSPVYQLRAAAIRMLGHWNRQIEHSAVLKQLIRDPHPQVRLEAIHALQKMSGLAAAEMVIDVLDSPMDDNLDFALDQTLRKLKEYWLPVVNQDPALFKGDLNKQLYALLTTEDQRVIDPLNNLLAQAGIDSELANKAWLLLARIGTVSARTNVLQKAIKDSDDRLLRAMANAPGIYDAVPENLSLLEPLFAHDGLSIRRAALDLAARWKTDNYADIIKDRVQQSEDMNEKMAACRALVALDQLEEVKEIATGNFPLSTKVAASAVWIESSPGDAVGPVVQLLEKLDDPDLANLLFLSFRKIEEGPALLEKTLEGKSISEEIAIVGLRVVQTSGLNLKTLEETLRKAGSVQAVGMELSAMEKEALIKDALENGNTWRGRQIYRRPELLCGSCHRTQREGGLSGPNLTTLGSYMTPNSILESILNPSTDIKQNYETVLITKKNGEIISGLLHRKTNTVTLIRQANNELIEIPEDEIAKTDVSPVSLMPAGLTRNLTRDELKDLLAYLVNLGK